MLRRLIDTKDKLLGAAARRILSRVEQRDRAIQSVGHLGAPDFFFIDPPFDFNSTKYAHIPQEVTGFYLLRTLLTRLGWASFQGKRILDFGCGVRVPRTLINLDIDLARYHGVDVNKEAMAWLSHHVQDERFSFDWINDNNPLYNPDGTAGTGHTELIERLSTENFDLGYLYSVITHTSPDETRRIFETLRAILGDSGTMYFTAFIDDDIPGFVEKGQTDRSASAYNLNLLRAILRETGWSVESVYGGNFVHQQAVLCRAA